MAKSRSWRTVILRNLIVCKKAILNSKNTKKEISQRNSFAQYPLLISHQVLSLYYLMVQASPLPSALLIILSKLWSAVSRLVLCLSVVLSKFMLLSLGPTMDLMTKTWPLCTSDRLNLRDRVLDEVEKNSFIALPWRKDHSRLLPLKNCVFQPRRV